jgi:hypothetical protein
MDSFSNFCNAGYGARGDFWAVTFNMVLPDFGAILVATNGREFLLLVIPQNKAHQFPAKRSSFHPRSEIPQRAPRMKIWHQNSNVCAGLVRDDSAGFYQEAAHEEFGMPGFIRAAY